jgi:thioredoxin-dependent peroxiredoxin
MVRVTRSQSASQQLATSLASDQNAKVPGKSIKKSTNSASSSKSETALKIGDTLPDITVVQDDDEEVSILELANESDIVIFMYPKANTPGCTKQACAFRDNLDEFRNRGYIIYGLS